MKERLQKLMAIAGIASRRASEDIIRAGRVRINGKVARIGDQADLNSDRVEVDGVRLNVTEKRVYIAVNKPRNVLTAGSDRADDERRTVREVIPHKGHLFSVGRLDADSEGLVVLTNDGEITQRLSHPRYRHSKTYRVVVRGLPTQEVIDRWQSGVFIEEGRTAPCYVKVIRGSSKESVLKIVMTEGKKRQIRRVASILGYPVLHLTRIAIGQLELGTLKPGEWRNLSEDEVKLMATPAPEIKLLRRRPPKPVKRTEEEEALKPRGTNRDDDVRSQRQRRYARGERDERHPAARTRPASDQDSASHSLRRGRTGQPYHPSGRRPISKRGRKP